MGELALSEDQHKQFTDAFAAFDTEGGGLLGPYELNNCMRSLGCAFVEVVLDTIINNRYLTSSIHFVS